MSIQNEDKAAPGRTYDQPATGSNSAASMGAGGTGTAGETVGTNAQAGDAGKQQQGGRTDDLLSGDADTDIASDGFVGEEAGELQTGMNGIGSLSTGHAGSRQSDDTRQ
jgi:hypothetical protein